MSNLVEIKAVNLKWCPIGFTYQIKPFDDRPDWVNCGINCWSFGKGCSLNKCSFNNLRTNVKVNSKKYEETIINKLKEIFPFKYMENVSIVKQKSGAITLYFRFLCQDTIVPILIDPCPWKESYTMEIPNDK